MAEFKYDVTEELGVISDRGDWTKELNMISWNGREPKYDIRDWTVGKSKMGKGVTLSLEEIKALKELLNSIDFE